MVSATAMAAPTNKSSDPFPTKRSAFGLDLKTRLFKRGWCGSGGILVVDLCPRAPLLRRRLLQRRRGAWEVVQEQMQILVCIDDIWKMVDLGSWFVAGRYSFLLQRLSWVGCQIWSSMACPVCCPGLIRSTAMASPLLASHLGGPQSCISAMEPCRARVWR